MHQMCPVDLDQTKRDDEKVRLPLLRNKTVTRRRERSTYTAGGACVGVRTSNSTHVMRNHHNITKPVPLEGLLF